MSGRWVNGENVALFTDLYELNMLQSYFNLGMRDTAVFDLFVRRLPPERSYLVACGLDDVLEYLETLHFSAASLSYLRSLGTFSDGFLEYLAGFRFRGDVYALPEGTMFFANEPVIEIIAPISEAQFVETFVMNQVHFQTLAASKAARVVAAAAGRAVIDFGLRRIHGTDAGLKAARAFYIAGVQATSNVLAGQTYGIPIAGTMAHSYVQAHSSEVEAFSGFVRSFPSTILLVDTYDTIDAVRQIIELKKQLGDAFNIGGIRLDSGDLLALSKRARTLLDEAGLREVQIFASNSLDEYSIEKLISAGAPIDGFGVGTRMGVSSDVPSLDTAYKLVEYAGVPRVKRAEGKGNLPGRKQVFRQEDGDVIGLQDETIEGERLLVKVMENGRRLESGRRTIEDARKTFQSNRARIRAENEPYSIMVSVGIKSLL